MSTLAVQNLWWREGKVNPALAKEYRRPAFHNIEELTSTRQAIILSGMRRVGKSTVMFQLIQSLIGRGIDPLDILYFSFDEGVSTVHGLLTDYGEATGRDFQTGQKYVFLDEVHKLRGWAEQLKVFYDSVPGIKFFASGSAALPLEREANTVLAGRAFYIKVEPLSFREFLEMKHGVRGAREGVWKDALPAYFTDYVKRPLPEMVDMEPGLLRRYVRESLVDRILYKDIPEAHPVDTELLRELLQLFYTEVNYTLNVDSLARDMGRSKRTILDAVQYMTDSYAVRVLRNHRPSRQSSSRKLKRVYPYHFCEVSNEDVDEPKLWECVVASLLDARKYWREGQKEVDFVVDGAPVEVKWKKLVSDSDCEHLDYFLKKYGVRTGYMVSKSGSRVRRVDGSSILTVPVWRLGETGGLDELSGIVSLGRTGTKGNAVEKKKCVQKGCSS